MVKATKLQKRHDLGHHHRVIHHKCVRDRHDKMINLTKQMGAFNRHLAIIRTINQRGIDRVQTARSGDDTNFNLGQTQRVRQAAVLSSTRNPAGPFTH